VGQLLVVPDPKALCTGLTAPIRISNKSVTYQARSGTLLYRPAISGRSNGLLCEAPHRLAGQGGGGADGGGLVFRMVAAEAGLLKARPISYRTLS
jgi:hypothetical protein